ncbi:Superoxide-proteinrating NADPH oxidase heavy chain subunit A [Sphaceloma murrayae]|uniref:Superoxide-proteinrating NADPH oxidase heavy chain subunit A n=1 Tax=Sphaceloma murrayae TaxID=2082308 RepID=A0A2K1QQU4_9PEZI|nr:Superoxide-proteinrating NADPH oxidase heavy chain subunit A [Sphaceloma murrayae]
MADDKPLNSQEIDDFVQALDKNNDGCISYAELEHQLDVINQELLPQLDDLSSDHPTRKDAQRHEFLRAMMGPEEKDKIPVADFKHVVSSWNVPSLQQEKKAESDTVHYLDNVGWARRLRAAWEVQGPEYVFLFVVVALQLGFGIWQCLKHALDPQVQAAFGWGVALAKFSAGALYPTLWFLLLSMSRWYSTLMRRYYYISRFVNWDRSQSFHIKISIATLVLATTHAIGHLSGTFVFGSRSSRQEAVGALLGPSVAPRPYMAYLRLLPGWTGLTALGILYIISLLSMPYIRKRSYEVFQMGHLLMFPFVGLLMAHGGLGLLQYPVLGILLAFPAVLVLIERCNRVLSGLCKVPARLDVLDGETITLTCTIPKHKLWIYDAGQYVFLQVPQLSFFQWHPFTISTCVGREMTLHIKTDGDWTAKLRELKDLTHVGIDGPYGAPAQRFYDFDQTIIVGAGIGVTPFSGILNDLQHREDHRWAKQRRGSTSSNASNQDWLARPRRRSPASLISNRSRSRSIIRTESEKDLEIEQKRGESSQSSMREKPNTLEIPGRHPRRASITSQVSELPNNRRIDLELYRRVDFHWIVRDKNYLNWFSDLLNRISEGSHSPNLDIRLHNHLTNKRTDISQHVYRWLLEQHRTESQPTSPLTGLIAPTHFGRPDFPTIFDEHYKDMTELFTKDQKRRRRVGVFFCGAPAIGAQLALLCREMTLRGREDGSGIEYFFQIEVFG